MRCAASRFHRAPALPYSKKPITVVSLALWECVDEGAGLLGGWVLRRRYLMLDRSVFKARARRAFLAASLELSSEELDVVMTRGFEGAVERPEMSERGCPYARSEMTPFVLKKETDWGKREPSPEMVEEGKAALKSSAPVFGRGGVGQAAAP